LPRVACGGHAVATLLDEGTHAFGDLLNSRTARERCYDEGDVSQGMLSLGPAIAFAARIEPMASIVERLIEEARTALARLERVAVAQSQKASKSASLNWLRTRDTSRLSDRSIAPPRGRISIAADNHKHRLHDSEDSTCTPSSIHSATTSLDPIRWRALR
jgi:hypothetical protein